MRHVSDKMVHFILRVIEQYNAARAENLTVIPAGNVLIGKGLLEQIDAEAGALGWIALAAVPVAPSVASLPPARAFIGQPLPPAPRFGGALDTPPHPNEIPGIPASQLLAQVKALIQVAETDDVKSLRAEIESWRKLNEDNKRDIESWRKHAEEKDAECTKLKVRIEAICRGITKLSEI